MQDPNSIAIYSQNRHEIIVYLATLFGGGALGDCKESFEEGGWKLKPFMKRMCLLLLLYKVVLSA